MPACQMARLRAHHASKPRRELEPDATFEFDPPATDPDPTPAYVFTGVNAEGYACYDET